MITHDDYEPGDHIRVSTGSEEWIVEVIEKENPVKNERSGWKGDIVKIVHQKHPEARATEEGDSKWGYDSQIVEVV